MKKVVFTAALLVCAAPASAGTIDLTTAGSSGTTNNAIFEQIDPQSTGTGVINSFVRISKANADVVSGYNTDARPLQFDENSSPQFTHQLLLSDVPIVTINGVAYRQFLLDINQQGVDPLLSLSELQIFLGNAPDLSGASSDGSGGISFGTNANLIYDLDNDGMGDSTIELNYNLNTGSGSGDMFAYIDNSLFTGANPYVYLYSSFGDPNNNNDGFEEWATVNATVLPPNAVPEPTSLALAAFGVLGLGVARWRRKRLG